MLSGGQERRLAVRGSSAAPDGLFCTSGSVTGVNCVWQGITLPPDRELYPLPFDHLLAAQSSRPDVLRDGDSGGPLVSYDLNLIGLISHGDRGHRGFLLYTPMQQVLHELHSYTLVPADVPDAAGEGDQLPAGGVSADWELSPPESGARSADTSGDSGARPVSWGAAA